MRQEAQQFRVVEARRDAQAELERLSSEAARKLN